MAQYYRGARAALIVYDVACKKTFQSVQRWLADLYKYTNEEDMVVLLVGNKTDLKQRAVSTEDARKLAELEGMYFIETSAKDATNVERAFFIVTNQLLQSNTSSSSSLRERRRQSLLIDGVEIGEEPPAKKESNCNC